jgi:hypothetical protein
MKNNSSGVYRAGGIFIRRSRGNQALVSSLFSMRRHHLGHMEEVGGEADERQTNMPL